MSIRKLPEEVSSAIAAGEVVERPSSVVKELVENSLDAGANEIIISIIQGGKGLIEVSDDGRGIPKEELPLAVARFATSKLGSLEDLFSIKTLGFRGEALSSIAAVSQLRITSRPSDQQVGSRITLDGSETVNVTSIGAAEGTTVEVRDLFFNVPARKKFLKTNQTERRRIIRLVNRYALAYPEVRFRLIDEGKERFSTTGGGDRREVLSKMYGVDTARQLLTVSASNPEVMEVMGYVSPPSITRSNRREIEFFVNGRWVQDSSLTAAVQQAYHSLLMVGRYPIAILFLDIPPDEVDVNVHPTKSEVRFTQPRRVFAVLQRAVRTAVLHQSPAPEIRLEGSWDPGSAGEGQDASRDWFTLHHGGTGESLRAEIMQPAMPVSDLPILRSVGQVGGSYLVAEGPDGLYLIDQHAAHERVLYERMMQKHEANQLDSQSLLEAETLELGNEQAELLAEQLPILRDLGFEIEPFGPQVFQIRSVPAMLTGTPPAEAVRGVVEDIEEDEAPLESEVEAKIAARVCKAAAVKAGQLLSLEEQRQLVRDLETCRSPRTCPHGRPTMIHLSVASLERQFGRRG